MSQMSEIEIYDRAVYAYLSSISDRIIYAPTSAAVRTITKKEEFSDKKPWNFISYHRNSSFDIDWNLMNNSATVYGDFVRLQQDSVSHARQSRYVQQIPVGLTYNVDIWASKAVEVQELALKLVSKLFMDDQVIEVPINPDGEDGRFHILNISWDDNSDLERETSIGRIYRHTISFSIDSRFTLVRDVNTVAFPGASISIYE